MKTPLPIQGKETFFAADRDTWRKWLTKHHAKKSEIWLIMLKRHVQRDCVVYNAAVEEALCFGWIDGKMCRIDDEQHAIRFTPRKPRSVWSELNKLRVQAMVAAGRMTEAGLALVRAAQESGQWEQAYAFAKDDATEIPPELASALARNKKARENFERFAPSYRKTYLNWLRAAKRDDTRRKRIQTIVTRSAAGKKPFINM